MSDSVVELAHHEEARALFGLRDQYLRRLCSVTGAKVVLRGNQVRITGEREQVDRCLETLLQWRKIVQRNSELVPSDIICSLGEDPAEKRNMIHSELQHSSHTEHSNFFSGRGSQELRPGKDRVGQIRAKTDGQKSYMDAMRHSELVLCDGPAGSGKTYLAVALALEALRSEQVRKIVLVRPAVEAGEKLGFLPGDMFAKVNPFLRPLLDAIYDMLDTEQVRRYLANDVIEIVPLAFMRGRTLNDTFMILDEAQNTTCTQMKMFLTRMGLNSRIVVTGDSTQIDLEKGVESGLKDGIRRLSRIPGVAIVRLNGQDIVRHRLVREIVSAYETTVDRDSSQS
ncbi:MAG: PhoH family protein [Planctomycetota bacterium]|nr:MAG: PhoH family protein [Planctomycetota bacterium]